MPHVLITGANRGLGLEFARQYCRDGWNVTATAREPTDELEGLCVRVEEVDMLDLDAVADFGAEIDELDLLIANAGTYGPKSVTSADDAEGWSDTFTVNTIAPFVLAQSVLPAIRASGGNLIAISTRMGSIEDNSSGGFIAYRSSKAALNMAWRSLAIDSGATCAVLHPGWVQTRMGGASAPLTPQDSVAGMRRVIDGLSAEDSGGFFSYDGSRVPW
ncbi:SDR family oxidoreductase [Sphingomonas lutea]|uniref:SDR family oxidoreductase n=1 Tax=Sphingomonas lutea TaxID=1045317 RepID=A0A7G9SIL1_9SPHN|nr:SDR family oxidoreductase [Sphingomonas lutea]QNN67686.1 SDR family oxidoreductase [Sphingomonas lutea]